MNPKMLLAVPFTGLGLYGGFRGNRWLRNRIAVFERFVIPSILAQTDQDFTLWVQWREEERSNRLVQELYQRLKTLPLRVVFTYAGIFMYDDKYPLREARERFGETLNRGLGDLFDYTEDTDTIIVLLQPSDDCYHKETVASVKEALKGEAQAVVFEKGFICNYQTLEVLEYNPKTTPPFAAIKFDKRVFFDPAKHLQFLGLKEEADKYPVGTPLPSHEYLPKCLKTLYFNERGFLVGCHGENISTHFNHPYGGARAPKEVLAEFGLEGVSPINLPFSLRKWVMRRLPHQWRRKLRYWFGEIWGQRIYQWLRS